VAFFGQKDEYVVSGSDDGNFFIWDARSAQIVNILAGSSGIVNVIVGIRACPFLGPRGLPAGLAILVWREGGLGGGGADGGS